MAMGRLRSLLLGCMTVLAAGPVRGETVRVCTTEWPPYTRSAGQGVGGSHTAVVVEAFRRLGFKAEVDSVAWERCWFELPKGTYQAIYSASWRAERAKVALYPATPLQSLSYVAVVRRDQAFAWDGKDLAALPQPLAAPRGYSIVDDLRARGMAVDDGAMKDSQDVEKLLAGRIGTAVIERSVALSLIRSMGLADKVAMLPTPVGPDKDYFLVIGRGVGGSEAAAAQLLARLDKVLAELKREGLADRLTAEEVGRR